MIIESVDIAAFGKLRDYKASFDGGFNLLEGNNESGKSTLAAFIVYMLYGFPDGERGELSERLLRTPFAAEETAGSMVIATKDGRYRIERRSLFGKNGWRDSFSLRNLHTGAVENDGTAPGVRFLGVGRQVFLETAFFGIGRMGQPDGETLREATENIVFSGDERQSVSNAARELSEAADRLASPAGNGALFALKKERRETEERLRRARERETALYAKEELLFVNRQKRDTSLAELEKYTSLETNYYNAVMIRDYDRLHELEDQTTERERALETFLAARGMNGETPDVSFLMSLSNAKGEYEGAQKARDVARLALEQSRETPSPVSEEDGALCQSVEAAGGTDALRGQADKIHHRSRRFAAWGVAAMALLAVALVAFILLFISSHTTMALAAASLGVLLLGVAAVMGGEWLRVEKERKKLYGICSAAKKEEFFACLARAAEARRMTDAWENERKRVSEVAEVSEHTYEEARERLSSLIHRFGKREEGETLVDAASRLETQTGDFLQELEKLRQSKEAADAEVRVLRAKLADKNEIAVRARVAPDDRERYCNQNVEDLHRGIEHFEQQLSKLLAAETELVSELSHFEETEPSASLAGQIALLDERIAQIEETSRVYRETAAVVAGGTERLRKEIAPKLSFDAGNLLYEMTDGTYTEVLADEENGLSFLSEDGPHAVRHLGDSTAEMAYISLRVALVGLIYRKEMPPLCFDGCTALQDKERAASFLRALRNLTAEGKQCLCFTADDRERRLADKIFTSYRYLAME
ncbi:MAG: AAA family ATPase [Clostridia bacterium]|nr:AAA family ATPase [Clostridia bacterium]